LPRYSDKQKAMLEEMMKKDIFEAAKTLLAKDGLKSLTMDGIAKEVGVSRSTLYNYFSDCQALFEFVEEQILEPIEEAVDEILQSKRSVLEKLEQSATEIFTRFYNHKELTLALWDIKNLLNYKYTVTEVERRERFIKKLIAHFREGRDAGVYDIESPELMGQMFFGCIASIFDSALYRGELVDPKKVVPILVAMVCKGICREKQN